MHTVCDINFRGFTKYACALISVINYTSCLDAYFLCLSLSLSLSVAQKRSTYDRFGKEGVKAGGGGKK